MRFMPYILMVLLALTTVAAVVTRPNDQKPAPTLAEKIEAACKPPLKVNDWWLDPDPKHPDLVHVSCYDPKGGALTYVPVER